MFAIWLADVLRQAGLEVVEVPGWQSRGRPEAFGPVLGVICHHTGPTGSIASAVELIKDGRPDLGGPLSQLLLDKDGTFHVVAAGRCNHAGPGRWQGATSGNTNFVGIEARNNGTDELWPLAQMVAYEEGVAAILSHVGADAVMAVGHKEWALPKGRKVDPSFDMVAFREDVEAIMTGSNIAAAPPRHEEPARAMLRKGDHGDSVKLLQRALGFSGKAVDGDFGPATDKALREFQLAHRLASDGKAGPKTWAALGV